MSIETTYPALRAGPRRDGAIQAAVSAKGAVAWSVDLATPDRRPPRFLLVWEGNVVVETPAGLTVYSREGKRLWDRRKQEGSAVAVGNALLYHENADCLLDAADLKGKLAVKDAELPGVANDDFGVLALWPREKDFLMVATYGGKPPGQDPQVIVRRSLYGQRICEWGYGISGVQSLPPLFIPEKELMLLAFDGVLPLDIKTQAQDRVVTQEAPPEQFPQKGGPDVITRRTPDVPGLKLPVDRPVDWCADPQGDLLVLGHQGEDKALVCMSLVGQEKWRWVDRGASDDWAADQPPVRGAGRRVFALTSRRVVAIEDGKLAWQYEFKDASPHSASSAADGSLLVTAGKSLVHLDPAGKPLFTLPLDQDILTPPVVDAQGGVYVATASRLVKVR